MIQIESLSMYPERALPSMAELDVAVEEGRVVRRDEDGLSVYVYSRSTFYDGDAWDRVTRAARGLVFRRDSGRLLALPFPKFFNLGEREDTLVHRLPDQGFRVTEKLDGSLIVVFHDGRRWRASTKGSLSSAQAQWAESWLLRNVQSGLLDPLRGATLLFEGVYPRGTFEDDLVVDYGDREELVLLSGHHTARRREFVPRAVRALASHLGVSVPGVYPFDSLHDVVKRAEELPVSEEGYVVQFLDGGLRVKVKGRRFVEAHKFLSGTAPARYFWASLDEAGRVPPDAWTPVPVDVRDDMLPLVRNIEAAEGAALSAVEEFSREAILLPGGRERAEWVKGLGAPWTAAVFAFLSGGRGRARSVIRKALRPDADGQVPELPAPSRETVSMTRGDGHV